MEPLTQQDLKDLAAFLGCPKHDFNPEDGKRGFKAGEGSKQQGVQELKQNYIIDSTTKVISVGSSSKVFKTTNKQDKSF